MSGEVVRYVPPPTVGRFMADDTSFVAGLSGPIGSGKSTGCVMKLFMLACTMPRALDGWRRTRMLVVRNTYRELQDTTIETTFMWLPKDAPEHGTSWHEQSMTWTFMDPVNKVHTEWLFRALDRPDHVRKLLSLEITWAWGNEARELGKAILDGISGRVGRFPRMQDYGWKTDPEKVKELIDDGRIPVVGEDVPYRYGILLDTNQPDTDHWWYRIFEEEKPKGYRLYRQPGAGTANAENLENLPPLYYYQQRQGKSKDWIAVYIDAEYGYVQEGKPVFPEFVDSTHVLPQAVAPVKGKPVVLGGDWGLTPAVVYLQQIQGTWVAVHETVATRLGAVNMAREVKHTLDTTFAGCPVRNGWGDPSGGAGSSAIDEGETVIGVYQDMGIPFEAVPGKDNPTMRREAVASALTTLTHAGRPRLMLSPACRVLRKAMAGGYRFRRVAVAGAERFIDKPDKNEYSHVAEALEYAMVGEGEGYALVEVSPEVTERRASGRRVKRGTRRAA